MPSSKALTGEALPSIRSYVVELKLILSSFKEAVGGIVIFASDFVVNAIVARDREHMNQTCDHDTILVIVHIGEHAGPRCFHS